jgi:ABC-type glycerol-3-phosphate transport system substrate-binding protein
MTDRQAAFNKLATIYKKNTHVKIVFETYAPSSFYHEKVQAAAMGKLLPEIFSSMGDRRELTSFVNAGYVADLTADMEKGWKDNFFMKPLSANSYEPNNEWNVKPGIYGVPIDVNLMEMYYNKDLFKQAGLDPEKPPRNWQEFIEDGKKLHAAGIQPFVCGFGEGWIIGAFAASYEWNLLGKQGMIDTINSKIPYDDPRWVRVYRLFEEMRAADMFASGIVIMFNKDAERLFATGKAAMTFNGSWGVNVYRSMNPALNYDIIMPPRLKEASFPMKVFSGESSFNINPFSPNKDKAIAFLRWLTEKEQQIALAKHTRNIPANRFATENLPPILKHFSQDIDKTFDILPRDEDWQVANAIATGLQSVIIGEKTPEQIARDIQTVKLYQSNVKK